MVLLRLSFFKMVKSLSDPSWTRLDYVEYSAFIEVRWCLCLYNFIEQSERIFDVNPYK